MKTNRFLFATLSAVMLFSASFLTSCKEEVEDLGSPVLKVSTSTLSFDADGKSADEFGGTVEITANREWVVSIPESAQSWLTASVESGNGNGAVTFSMPASEESNSAKVAIQVLNDWGVALEEIVTVSQGEGSVGGATGEVIFNETVGTTVVQKDGNYYPYVTDYTEWNSTGMGASTVTFSGENTTVRSSGLASTGYEGASGINSIFFGTAPATFTVEKISLTSEQKDLNLVFGGSRYIYDTKDNTFVPESLVVSLSADGNTWTNISYKVNKEEGESWVLCESNISLKESASSLYIKFTCSEASVIRMDDIKLSEGTGGAEVDLGAGTVTPDPGTDPEVDDSDAIFYETVGTTAVQKDGDYFPYVSDYTEWNTTGTGAASVTFSGENATVRSSGLASTGYAGASGVNNIFFGTAPANFTVEKIALTSSQKNLNLTFGGSRYIYASKDNTFVPENLVVSLSADGETWSTISYVVNKSEGESWVLCEANFSLKEAASSLYIKFTCSEASVTRVDDIKLTEGKGGDSVDLGAGTVTPDPGTDPEVTPDADGDYVFDYEALGTSWLNATEKTLGGVDWYIDGMKNSGDYGNIGFSYFNEVGGSCYNKTAFGTGVTEVIVDHKSGDALTVYAGASENPTEEVTPTVAGNIYTYSVPASCPYVAFKNNSTAYINLNSLVINYEGTIGEGGTVTPDPGTDPEVDPDPNQDSDLRIDANSGIVTAPVPTDTVVEIDGVSFAYSNTYLEEAYGSFKMTQGGAIYNLTELVDFTELRITEDYQYYNFTVYAGTELKPLTDAVDYVKEGDVYVYAIPAGCKFVTITNESSYGASGDMFDFYYGSTGDTLTPPVVEGTFIIASDFGVENEANLPAEVTVDGYTFMFDKGTHANMAPRTWKDNTEMRLYTGNTLTIKGANLKHIKFTCAKGGKMTVDNGEYADVGGFNWNGDSESVTFTINESTTFTMITID